MIENSSDVLEELKRDIKRNRQIFLVIVVGPFLAVGVGVGALWNQVHASNRIAKDAHITAEFVTDCLIKPNQELCPIPLYTTTTTGK